MPRSIRYDSRSFMIDGRRRFLSSGAVHYFRTPHELWRDRLVKSKRAGLNTIETYVAWNFHEYEEGRYDFEGDRDLHAYLSLCEELGLYVIIRPGPYICSEWDFGGFPSWLIGKSGIELRTYNSIYLDAVDRWFDQLVPIIARHQRTKGGSIVMVQVENEYSIARQGDNNGERGRAYMEYLRDALRTRGIRVPLNTCAGRCEGCIECMNAHNPADHFDELKQRQPDAPFFATEFWSAWYDLWGSEHHSRSAENLEYETMRIIARGGGGYNYYMWHGGTNFGYSTMYLQTTSYDFHAPLSEAGRLTKNYEACKRAADLAHEFEDLLTSSDAGETGSFGCDPRLELHHRVSENGSLLFVENPTDKQITTPLWLCGSEFSMTMAPKSIRTVLMDYMLNSDVRVLYSTAAVKAALDSGTCLVYGPAGEFADLLLEVRGDLVTERVRFPENDQAAELTRGCATLVVMNEALAARTTVFPNKSKRIAVIGPALVRGCSVSNGTVELEIEDKTGFLNVSLYGLKQPLHVRARLKDTRPALPELTGWRALPGSPEAEIHFDDSNWQLIGKPVSMIELGNGSNGYGWYRTLISCGVEMESSITFTGCGDILTLFVNGERLGRSEAPPENHRASPWTVSFPIHLRPGRNVVAVLADNLGLVKGAWQIDKPMEQEAKGIFGEVTLADGRIVDKWRFMGRLEAERKGYVLSGKAKKAPWMDTGQLEQLRKDRVVLWAVEFVLPAKAISPANPIFIRMDGMGKGVIWLNGHNLGRYWQIGPQRNYYAPEPWLQRKNLLVIAEEDGCTPDEVRLVYDEKGTSAAAKLTIR